MNAEHPLVPVSGRSSEPTDLALPPGALPPEPEQAPIRKVKLVMYGRWRLAITLAAVLAVIGGTLGALLPKPKYTSHGLIRVTPVLPTVLHDLSQEKQVPMFESYIGSQAALIQSQRVLDVAMKNDAWVSLKRDVTTPEAKSKFAQSLEVTHPQNTEMIVVAFTDTDPNAALAGVKSIVDSYRDIYIERESQGATERSNQLVSRRSKLREDLSQIREQRNAIARQYGTDDLRSLYAAKVEEQRGLEARLREVEMALRLAAAARGQDPRIDARPGPAPENPAEANPNVNPAAEKPAANPVPVAAPQPNTDLSVAAIASFDPKMRDYMLQREKLSTEEARLELNLGPQHRQVIEAKALLAHINQQIDDYAAQVRQGIQNGTILVPGAGGTAATSASLEELHNRYAVAKAMFDAADKQTRDIGQKLLQMQDVIEQEKKVQESLDQTSQRIDNLQVESPVTSAGHIRVDSDGDMPLKPSQDRRKLMAFLGVFGGGCVGFGLVLLVGLMDGRLRHLGDAEEHLDDVPVLGVLPTLPEDLAAPDQAAIAAHCVHQVRTLMQIGSDSHGRRVFSVTSPESGDGKTSLTLALSLSFATSGARTLMIDCDLAGGGLTHRVETIIRRKIGDILLRKRLVTAEQIEQALKHAQQTGTRLGEALVQLGFIDQDSIDEALNVQESNPVGFLDALDGEPLAQCVAGTGVENLFILPIGAARARHVARISPGSLRHVLEECRRQFDAVIVDTGPVPASLEASHAAAEADGVLLVISRGVQKEQVAKALDHLTAIGSHVVGVVFNRAEARDVQVLAESAPAIRHDDEPPTPTNGQESARYDPVARAVAHSAPSRSPKA